MKIGDVFRIGTGSVLFRVEKGNGFCYGCVGYEMDELCKRFPNCFLIEGCPALFKWLGKSETKRAIKAKTEILTY
jgi:hypothetical protein